MQYIHRWDDTQERKPLAPSVTSSEGSVVKGDRIMVGFVLKRRGTGSRPHRHPNEQFNYVVKGSLKVNIEGQEGIVRAGEFVHVPANALHNMVATPEEDVVFLMIKDTTAELIGIPEDGQYTGPYYEPGFEPKE